MTDEYHHLINRQAYHLAVYAWGGGISIMVNKSLTMYVYFHCFEALNDAFEVQFFFRA